MADNDRKVAVITGASSGIGLAAADALLAKGWQVIGVGRDMDRTAQAKIDLGAAHADAALTMLQGDLSSIAEAARLAAEISAVTDRIDLLANNAGGMANRMQLTGEGLEANFAANHVGPFHLTRCLLPLLRTAAQSAKPGDVRIVMTSSDGSEMIPSIDCDDLQNLTDWNPGKAYCTGKLANVLFARALAERLSGEGIVAHAFHPGTVDSNFFAHVPEDTRRHTDRLEKTTPEMGADTLVWLATSSEAGSGSGGYWSNRQPRKPNPVVEQEGLLDRFWAASERLVATALG